MKRIFTILLAASAVILSGCAYNDDDLWNRVDNLEQRVKDLETAVQQANTDIGALQDLVDAVETGIYVESFSTTTDGHTLLLSNGETLTLKHGNNGSNAPVIGVAKHEGVYYWTMGSENEWLLDGESNKIPVSGKEGAQGTPGQAGATPQLGVDEDGYWTVTVNGQTTQVKGADEQPVKATGEDGLKGADGDSFFKSVVDNGDSVKITLSDNTVFELPKKVALSFTVKGAGGTVFVKYGTTKTLDVAATGVADYMVSKPDGWKVSYETGKLSITAPASGNANADLQGDVAIHAVASTGASLIRKIKVEASEADLRVLTFEDIDYVGPESSPYWSALVDSKQYNGPLLYPEDEELYCWYDEDNTYLAAEFPNGWGDYQYWGGGHAVSNYVETDITKGSYTIQLAVYYKDTVTGKGGRNGSENFCVHNGYKPEGDEYTQLPYIYFMDNEARVVDHMYITATTYGINSALYGDGFTDPMEPEDYLRIVATGYDENFEEVNTKLTFELANGIDGPVMDWQKWDLSALGKVFMIEFNLVGTVQNSHSLASPAYFAYDDVAVRFE